MLSSASQVGLKPLESNAVDAKTSLEFLQQDVVVDRVECSREIQKDQYCKISTIDGQENVRKYRQNSSFSGVARTETRLNRRKQIGSGQLMMKLVSHQSLQ